MTTKSTGESKQDVLNHDLIWASLNGRFNAVLSALASGAEINAKDEVGGQATGVSVMGQHNPRYHADHCV